MRLAPDMVARTRRAGKAAQEASDAAMKTGKAAMQLASDAMKTAEAEKLYQLIDDMRLTVKGSQQTIRGPRLREVLQSNNEPARDCRNEEEHAEEAARKAQHEADAREQLC
jgi:hypothetical protein